MNNNAYTNLMARENLRYAAQTVEALRATRPDAYEALVRRTALEPSEVEAWMRAAESMYVPYDEKLKLSRRMTTSWTGNPGISRTRQPTAIRCCCFTIRSTSIVSG